jgi:hypothetical protein
MSCSFRVKHYQTLHEGCQQNRLHESFVHKSFTSYPQTRAAKNLAVIQENWVNTILSRKRHYNYAAMCNYYVFMYVCLGCDFLWTYHLWFTQLLLICSVLCCNAKIVPLLLIHIVFCPKIVYVKLRRVTQGKPRHSVWKSDVLFANLNYCCNM